jgi:hypothetical protein
VCSSDLNVYYAPKEYALGGSWRMVERLQAMNYKEPPYSTRYPALLHVFVDGDPAIPTGNVIMRNVSYGGKFLTLHTDLDFTIVSVKDNLIADPEICIWRNRDKKESEKFSKKYSDEAIKKEMEKYGNMIIDTDPGFVDLEHENFQLKDDSPAYKLGFKRIPIEKIGLYIDEYRTSLPEKTTQSLNK